MRKQYHFRKSKKGLLAWDVDKLINLSRNLPVIDINLSEIKELDEDYWFEHEEIKPSCRVLAHHAKLINETDLQYPVILSNSNRVMDGMHRVCKALILGHKTIKAVIFTSEPEPDFIGIHPDDLPY